MCDFVIANAGLGPFAEVNVTVTVSGAAGMLKLQVVPPPPTTHAVGVPLKVPVEPAGGVSVKITGALNVAITEQLAIPAAGPQLMPPPWTLTGLLVTVPPAFPARFTVNRNVFAANAAVADVMLGLIVKVQVATELALQGPAVQPVKTCPEAGVAVSVTDVPLTKVVEQTLGGVGFAQLISLAIVGLDVLVTDPLPVMLTEKGLCCEVNNALTV